MFSKFTIVYILILLMIFGCITTKSIFEIETIYDSDFRKNFCHYQVKKSLYGKKNFQTENELRNTMKLIAINSCETEILSIIEHEIYEKSFNNLTVNLEKARSYVKSRSWAVAKINNFYVESIDENYICGKMNISVNPKKDILKLIFSKKELTNINDKKSQGKILKSNSYNSDNSSLNNDNSDNGFVKKNNSNKKINSNNRLTESMQKKIEYLKNKVRFEPYD